MSIPRPLEALSRRNIPVMNLYLYGSQVYGTSTPKSDWDFIAIVPDPLEQQVWEYVDSLTLNFNFYSPEHFQDLINRHQISALEAIFSTPFLVQKEFTFTLDLPTLRESISQKSSHSFVKAKKKFLVEKDLDSGRKSLFHALRILDFGIQIATTGKINNFQSANHYFEKIKHSTHWEELHQEFKPIFNQLSSEFKSVAPKGKDS